MLLPLCAITREQMIVQLSLQSKSSRAAAALAPEGLDPDAHPPHPPPNSAPTYPSLAMHSGVPVAYSHQAIHKPPVVDKWGPGLRVPTLIISPFARRGFVDHTLYDTTSILKMIGTRYGLAPLAQRDAHANDLLNSLDLYGPAH